MGSGSDDGNAHTSVDISNFGVGSRFSHFSASRADSFFRKILASLPSKPSVETTNGEKCRRCSRQAPVDAPL
jgi:hypothetical protein